jgi:transposase-like protein
MPRKILPSQQKEQALLAKLSQGIADLSTLMVETAAVWIQRALEREREVFLQRPWAQRPTDAKGYANGYEPRTLATAEGPMQLAIPQVRATDQPFRSQTLELLKNRTDSLELLAVRMYVGGLSYADIAETFRHDLGVPNMSETVVRELCASLQGEYDAFVKRDLSGVDLLYLFLDGIYLRLDRRRKTKEAVLVARGYTRAGRTVLLGMAVGPRESYQAWKSFLSDLRDRGLRAPLLVTSDGCAGMIKAIGEVYPEAARQRCLFHLRATLMAVVPAALKPEIKDRLEQVLGAVDYEAALQAGRQLIADYQGQAQAFVDKLDRHLEAMLVYYKFPQNHWKHLRTSNTIERLFQEVKRRTKVIPAFGKEASCLMLCHAVLVDLARKKPWRGLRVTAADLRHLELIQKHLGQYGKDIRDFRYQEAA